MCENEAVLQKPFVITNNFYEIKNEKSSQPTILSHFPKHERLDGTHVSPPSHTRASHGVRDMSQRTACYAINKCGIQQSSCDQRALSSSLTSTLSFYLFIQYTHIQQRDTNTGYAYADGGGRSRTCHHRLPRAKSQEAYRTDENTEKQEKYQKNVKFGV
ncbi:hypothetical protein WUBG_07635 [Wuchereria bancrofti]|uniref:Uncharacterized protein n=1 Tax=Wuchereria bancrofti TaxID=6293 RepID=J9EWC5_WUCBA|nr:hypothetical protein WUBG_07635 [Wuchereria bancrofti]